MLIPVFNWNKHYENKNIRRNKYMSREVKYPNFIGVSVDEEMLKKLKELADLRESTVSQTVRFIIKQSMSEPVKTI